MKSNPLTTARIEWGDDGVPRSGEFDDVYAPKDGAWAQANHVFLRGTGLPERWRAHHQFTILETGFGLGTNFLATWAAWRADAQRCTHLTYVSVELYPPTIEDLERAHAHSPEPELAQALRRSWPPLTPNFHVLEFDDARVRLILAYGDIRTCLPQIVARVDAFYLDGFAPAKNPQMWDARVLRSLGRLARDGATVATWSAARAVRDGLRSGGFKVEAAQGWGRKKDMTVAEYAPSFFPKRPSGREAFRPISASGEPVERRALVIGAGLAGAHTASALARAGWHCTVLDRAASPASGASGNPAGIFHPTVHADDGPHARLLRAASLLAHQRYRQILRSSSGGEYGAVAPIATRGKVTGACDGLFRADVTAAAEDLLADSSTQEIAQRLSTEEAVSRTRLPSSQAGLWYPHGGWIDPGALTRHLLDSPGIEFFGGFEAATLERVGSEWTVRDATGDMAYRAPLVVLAGGHLQPKLLQACNLSPWPTQVVRGQVSWWTAPPGQSFPIAPMAGLGYAIGLPDQRLVCGATSQPDDGHAEIRDADHAFNLERARALTGLEPPAGAALQGRVGWRLSARDRLPVVGALPLPVLEPGTRCDQARLIPRLPGLFALGALGSRGLTWGPLVAEVLTAWVEGTPFPVEADLLDALDPARWLVRQSRGASGVAPSSSTSEA